MTVSFRGLVWLRWQDSICFTRKELVALSCIVSGGPYQPAQLHLQLRRLIRAFVDHHSINKRKGWQCPNQNIFEFSVLFCTYWFYLLIRVIVLISYEMTGIYTKINIQHVVGLCIIEVTIRWAVSFHLQISHICLIYYLYREIRGVVAQW